MRLMPAAVAIASSSTASLMFGVFALILANSSTMFVALIASLSSSA